MTHWPARRSVLRVVPPSVPPGVAGPDTTADVAPRPLRVALYSHDALGLGHLRRNLALATAFAAGESRPDVLLFAGALESTNFARPEGCDLVTLPSLRKDEDGSYGARQLSFGLPEVLALRSSILTSALSTFAPDVLVVDKHPLGAFDELLPALESLQDNGATRIVLGLRDVLDDAGTSIAEWATAGSTAAVERFFDQVWVYGDPEVFCAVTEYQLPPSVAGKVVYTGYLAEGRAPAPADAVLPPTEPFVLGMVGGGQDGGALAENFAAMPIPSGHRAVLVTGPQMNEQSHAAVRARAADNPQLTVLRSVGDGQTWISAAAAVIGMGGYNTVCEMLAAGTPALVVPRVVPRLEQLVRAQRLARSGAVDLMHPDDLSPTALGGWAAVAVHRGHSTSGDIDLGGLARLPHLLDLLTGRATPPLSHPSDAAVAARPRRFAVTAPIPLGAPAERIGYVLKMYPRFSETFVVSEVLARESAGEEIEIFSLRAPADGRFHESLARVRAGTTYLTHSGRRAQDLWALLARAGRELDRLPDVLADLLEADMADAAQAVELALLVREREITHLHAHFASVATTVARLASKLTGVPFSFTAHAKDIYHVEVDAADLRSKLADAHHAITVSAFNVSYLEDVFGADAAGVRLVYNGLDLDTFGYDRSAQRPGTICSVGRLVEKKGFDVLVNACALLAAQGRLVDCEIVGTGPMFGPLQARIDAHGLTGHVRLLGALPQPGVRDVLRRNSVFAAPCVVGADGNRDGLPTVLLEAMALGTACVGTDVTGLPEVLRDGDTGLVVGQGDAAGLAVALARMLDDDAERQRFAGNARRLVEDRFDSDRQAAELARLVAGTGATAPRASGPGTTAALMDGAA